MGYRIINETDGIMASGEVYHDRRAAERGVDELRARFMKQDYYLCANGTRIKPAQVKLSIIPADEDED